MAIEFDGSSEYLTLGSTPVTVYPLSMSCWFTPGDLTATSYLVWLGDSANNLESIASIKFHGGDDDQCVAESISTDSFELGQAFGGNFVTGADEWQHVVGVFASNASRVITLNGDLGNEGSNTTTVTGNTPDEIAIGVAASSTPTGYHDGALAEVGIWNVTLTDAEKTILSLGYSPRFVRPQNLVVHSRLVRSRQELIGGVNWTDNGTPTVASHPRIIVPSKRKIFSFAAAGGPTIVEETITEGAKASDSITDIVLALESLTEGAEASDSITEVQIAVESLTEGVEAGDSNSETMLFIESLTEGILAGETNQEALVVFESILEGALASDENTESAVFFETVSEGAIASDAVTETFVFSITVIEGAIASDVESNLLLLIESITEGIIAGDFEGQVGDTFLGVLRIEATASKIEFKTQSRKITFEVTVNRPTFKTNKG